MTIVARFRYRIQPGRMDEFRAKLKAASDPRFASAQMPQAMHQSSMNIDRSVWRAIDPTGQPIMHTGSRQERQREGT